MTEIYIVRHGESESNAKAVLTGQIDLGLSSIGLKQAECVTDFFKNIKIDAVYSSDLQRAVKTIEGVSKDKGVAIETERALREIYAGAWEGMPFTEIEAEHTADYEIWRNRPWDFVFPDGEATLSLADRVCGAIKGIAEKNASRTIVISTHSTPIRAFLSTVMIGGLEAMSKISLKNGSVTRLTLQ